METSKPKKQMPIAVYVRQRPQSKQEIEENAPCVLEIPSQKEICVKHTYDKRYVFDYVFGPKSRQIDVYYKVLEPLIAEVLDGYNCTVFAYGQTGTGKTYTILGNLEGNSGFSAKNPEAGLVTRAAIHIFKELASPSISDYTVHVSFIELYNEELKDLLRENDTVPLRLYEDPQQKGSVVIQNLLERTVCSAEEVCQLLEKGMEKRQTASTLLNDQSSRSHCVLTISIHVKELLVNGEETVRTGKLNLVDLAGSENISRSGAVNTRAREAGNINQSLLTLGRVIKALVEQQHHIPYRDSKLTRILQDSLGGRTKTSIIATVSPALPCLDETVSTLDYAKRACLIVNCPEANKNSSKSQVIDALNKDIARLQKDIAALRTGSGFYVDSENYQDLLTEKEKMENLILGKNEIILRLEQQIQHLRKMVESENKRWDALRESFNFTKSKCEEYRRKGLRAKAEAKTLDGLLEAYREQGRTAAAKNKNAKGAVQTFANAIGLLQDKLNTCYNRSSKQNSAVEQLLNKILDAIGGVEKNVQKYESESARREIKMREIVKRIADKIDRFAEKNKANDEEMEKLDLSSKAKEVDGTFEKEESDSVNYCRQMKEDINAATESVCGHIRSTVDKVVQNTVPEFETKLKNQKAEIVKTATDLSEKIHQTKTDMLNGTAKAEVLDKYRKQHNEVFAQIEDSFNHSLCLIIKRKKRMQEIREEIAEYEKEDDEAYEMYNHILSKIKSSSNKSDTTMQAVITTSKETAQKLKALDPISELEKITSHLHKSDEQKQEILDKYVEDVKLMYSRFDSELRRNTNSAVNETKQISDEYIAETRQNHTAAKESMYALCALTQDVRKNHDQIHAVLDKLDALSEKMSSYQDLPKKIQGMLTDAEGASHTSRNQLLNIRPAGDTPQKREYNYAKDVHFQTPTIVKSLKENESVLDVSVGSLNISSMSPGEIEGVEEFLEQADISINDSVLEAEKTDAVCG